MPAGPLYERDAEVVVGVGKAADARHVKFMMVQGRLAASLCRSSRSSRAVVPSSLLESPRVDPSRGNIVATLLTRRTACSVTPRSQSNRWPWVIGLGSPVSLTMRYSRRSGQAYYHPQTGLCIGDVRVLPEGRMDDQR